ncbi:MAG: GerMN domain-containing protein [Nitrospirota bacterium]
MKTGRGIFLLLLLASFLASAGAGFFYYKEKFAFESSFIAEIESRHALAEQIKKKKTDMRLYDADKHISETESTQVLRKDTMLVVAEDIIRKQVKPYSVRLLDLYMDREGIVYIDFGDELRKNFHGDTLEELNILAGLFREMKAAVPGFKALKILIEGREAESFGGHVDISKPIGEEIAEKI